MAALALLAAVLFVAGMVISIRGFLGLEPGPFFHDGGPPLPGGPPTETYTALEVPEGQIPLSFAAAGWVLGGACLAVWNRERLIQFLGLSGGIVLLTVGIALSGLLPNSCPADAPCWGGSAWAAGRGLLLSGLAVLMVGLAAMPIRLAPSGPVTHSGPSRPSASRHRSCEPARGLPEERPRLS